MSITKNKIGEYDNKEVFLYTLDNHNGLVAEIINYGGIIKKLVYNGVDVVLGRDTLEEYLDNDGCFGALIGRNSNRIEDAQFEINTNIYTLAKNNGRNNIHGGVTGFDQKVWEAKCIDRSDPSLELSLVSPDGEEGFPGEVKVKVTYTLTKENAISIHYEGVSDKDTILNMTNHTYFNLNGHASGTIENHKLWLASSFYTPNTEECIPCGEVRSTKQTPFDFSENQILGEGLNADCEQIKMFKGFDHNFALDGGGYRLAGRLTGDKTGIVMEMYTDQKGVQLYSGNWIDENRVCKDGALYPIHGGICMETQAFPNFTRFSHFPHGFLKKQEKYDTVTAFKFI